jgi:hypothetical protein
VRSLSNVVVSADKLQILRFAKDDNTPGLLGHPDSKSGWDTLVAGITPHFAGSGVDMCGWAVLDVDVFSI